ncbi:hypothetical protein CHLRE_12g526051v5 [Chlamydomonas reinhardtii]|uniref:Protein kinase domain-containing protein n=1 Tax=Chlamydomonas reinhardtii TaxID=3055 RepID=A0A2K3D4F2_CHLRE|nr:uncharacterized protein CHLRE_12g526051v5 [Chlamydomonas reinhardtii]PNW75413.1 hypothetical protein CHLRE_12g526051v5 [Chlamydomonas reinhardtii]
MNTTSFIKGPAVKAACIAILAGTATFVLARRGGLLRILRRKSDCKPKDKSCSAKSGIATVSSSPNDAAAVPLRDDLQPTKAADEAADATSSSGGELAGLAAAAGCEHAVQCLGYRLPTDDDERAELLLSCAEGGSVENLLNALAKEHFDRIDNAPERRRTGKNKDKYEMLPYPGNTLMDEADLKGMLRAMALFIKHLNARGYMHFDLKPANLLYDIAPDGSKVFRVCDFNLAVKTDSNGRVARAQGGTRGFWAWETYCQLEGLEVKHPITRAADVASMGLVLADAAGLHCLGGGTQAYLEYLRDLPRRTPPALKELIEWMVAEDPAARPTPDQILAHRWLTE